MQINKQSHFSKYILLIISVIALNACNNSKSEHCKYGNPTALFSPQIDGVSDYSFVVNGNNSSEKMLLSIIDGLPIRLEILQSGCNELEQEFRIELMDANDPIPNNFPAENSARFIAGFFIQLANKHPDLLAFGPFGEAIGKKSASFKYNEPILVGDGFSAQIDKMKTSNSTLFTLIFKQSKE